MNDSAPYMGGHALVAEGKLLFLVIMMPVMEATVSFTEAALPFLEALEREESESRSERASQGSRRGRLT